MKISTKKRARNRINHRQAEDPDEGVNAEIRYQILGREDAPRFAIDPLSGQVRSVASFGRDAGRVFGFDVKATDRRGAENGRSSIANVFVSSYPFHTVPCFTLRS